MKYIYIVATGKRSLDGVYYDSHIWAVILLSPCVIQLPRFVHICSQDNLLHEKTRQKAHTRYRDHNLPGELNALCKRCPDRSLERLLKGCDGWNDGIRNLNALW